MKILLIIGYFFCLICCFSCSSSQKSDRKSPDLSFLTSKYADLKINFAIDEKKINIIEGDVVIQNDLIARISIYDRPLFLNNVFPKDSKMFENLRTLIVVDCKVKQEIPAYFSNLTTLVHFEISGNPIVADITQLSPPPKLKYFNIANTSIHGLGDNFLLKGKNIERFDITNTDIIISPSVLCESMPLLNRACFSIKSISKEDQKWEEKVSRNYSISKWSGSPFGGGACVVLNRLDSGKLIEGKPKEEVMKKLMKKLEED